MEEGGKLATRLEALQNRWSDTPVTLSLADMAGGRGAGMRVMVESNWEEGRHGPCLKS